MQNENIHLFSTDKYPPSCQLRTGRQRVLIYQPRCCRADKLGVSALVDLSPVVPPREGVWCDISAKLLIAKETL